jgi:hypothetical protein
MLAVAAAALRCCFGTAASTQYIQAVCWCLPRIPNTFKLCVMSGAATAAEQCVLMHRVAI